MSTVIPGGLAASYSQKQAQKPATSRAVPGTLVLRDSVGRINARSALFTNSGGFVGDPVDDPTQVPLTAKVTLDSTAFGIFNKQGQSCFAINVGPSTDSSNRGTIDFFDRFDGTWRRSFSLKNGNVGIGTPSGPEYRFHVVTDGGTSVGHFDAYGGSSEAGITCRSAGGTLASPTAITAGRRFAYFVGGTYGSTGFVNCAAINFVASENHTDTARGCFISFDTAANGQAGRQERLRIDASGNVGISTSNPISTLHVGSNVTNSGFSTTYGAILCGNGQSTSNLADSGNHACSLLLKSIGNASGEGGALLLGANSNHNRYFAAIKGFIVEGGNNTQGHICFSTRTNSTDTSLTERLRIKANGQVRFVPLSADPTGFVEDGDVYYNSSTNKLRVRAAGNWVDLH